MWNNIYKEKANFIKEVETALMADPRSNVEQILYQRHEQGLEIVTVEFIGGGFRRINVTGNSNGANFMEIGRAVYDCLLYTSLDLTWTSVMPMTAEMKLICNDSPRETGAFLLRRYAYINVGKAN